MGRPTQRSIRHIIGRVVLPFGLGVLVGWLLIGWWLWPVQQTNSAPWLMRADYQERYLRLVAAYYRHTGDLQGTREALKGWDSEKLAEHLGRLALQSDMTEDIVQLAAALSLPVETHTGGLLDRDFFLWTILLSASPLVLALVLAMYPLLRSEGGADGGPVLGEGLRALDSELGALLAEEEPLEKQLAPAQQPMPVTPIPPYPAGPANEDQSPEEILADIFGKRQERLARDAALSEELEEIPAAELALKARRVLEQIVRSNETLGRGAGFVTVRPPGKAAPQ